MLLSKRVFEKSEGHNIRVGAGGKHYFSSRGILSVF